jgi:hypothetical protein
MPSPPHPSGLTAIGQPAAWLFPGRLGIGRSEARLQAACRLPAREANLGKSVTVHTLRHSFATHRLEAHRYPHLPGVAQPAGWRRRPSIPSLPPMSSPARPAPLIACSSRLSLRMHTARRSGGCLPPPWCSVPWHLQMARLGHVIVGQSRGSISHVSEMRRLTSTGSVVGRPSCRSIQRAKLAKIDRRSSDPSSMRCSRIGRGTVSWPDSNCA